MNVYNFVKRDYLMKYKYSLQIIANFEHTGQIPCKMLFYRVIAQRNEQISEPSNMAVVNQA